LQPLKLNFSSYVLALVDVLKALSQELYQSKRANFTKKTYFSESFFKVQVNRLRNK